MSRGDAPSTVVKLALGVAWVVVSYFGVRATVRMLDDAGPSGSAPWDEWLTSVAAAYGGLLVVGWITLHWTHRHR